MYIRYSSLLWSVVVVLVLLIASSLLSGCQSVTIKRGDETVTASSFLTKLSLVTSCAQYDPNGNLLSQTSQNFGSQGDVEMLHEAGALVGQAAALAAKLAAKGATGGAAPGVRGAVGSYGDTKAVTACNGEKVTTIPMLEAKEP